MSLSRFRFYGVSGKAWSSMLASISSAKESVFLEMYILEEGDRGSLFLSELERKAREGVKVILVLDSLGSFALSEIAVDRLRSAGAEVLFFSHFWKRTHRKLLIVDGYTVFLGGVNIAERFAPWRDLEVRISGKRFASAAMRSFGRMYRSLGGKDPSLSRGSDATRGLRARLWFIEHGIGGKRMTLRRHYERHIDEAKTRITLVTPYLVPRRWLIAKLHSAILRKVKVEIIVPERTDYRIVDRVNYRYLSLFASLGADVKVSSRMNHAKALIIDGREATIGSHNIDPLSFERNVESGVFFEDETMVRELERIVDDWRAESKPLDEVPRFHWYDILISLLLPFFASVL